MLGSGKWGSKAYVESLHRTYNIPLPERDDGSFERALQFREREKQFYSFVEQENDQLKHRVQKLESTLEQLEQHSSTLLQFYEDSKRSSKSKANVSRVATTPTSGSSDSHVRQESVARPERIERRGKGSTDEVSGEVLPAELPDPSGQTDQHAGDGSESREGAESGGGNADTI